MCGWFSECEAVEKVKILRKSLERLEEYKDYWHKEYKDIWELSYKQGMENCRLLKQLELCKQDHNSLSWIKTSDKRPEYGQKVLVKCPYGELETALYCHESKPYFLLYSKLKICASFIFYWMPLPPQPKY